MFYGWWVVVGSFLLLFLFAGAGFYSFSIFIKPLEKTFGWSRSQVAMAMSIYMVVGGIMAPLLGYLIDRFNPRKIMAVFAMGYGAAFILVSQTQSLWFFYTMYALLAITGAGLGFLPVSAVLTRWFIRRRGTALGIAMLGISTGGMVMSPLIEYFNVTYSWRVAFVFLGVLVWVIGLPVILLIIRHDPRDMGLLPDNDLPETASGNSQEKVAFVGEVAAEQGWPLKPVLRTRQFWAVVVTFILAPAAQMGVLQHQVPLITGIGISEAMAAGALGLTAGLGGVGKLSFGRISELIPVHYTALFCFGFQALGVFVLYRATGMTHIWGYVFLFGFAMGGNIVLLPIVIGHYFGLVAFGMIMGLVTFFQALGSGSGAIISGLVYDATGSYEMALLLYVSLYLAAIIAIFTAGRPREYRAGG